MRTFNIPETRYTRRITFLVGHDGRRGWALIVMITQTAHPAPAPLCCWVGSVTQHPGIASGRVWACYPTH